MKYYKLIKYNNNKINFFLNYYNSIILDIKYFYIIYFQIHKLKNKSR